MASVQKSYFLSPSWTLEPSEVVLGSVIVSLTRPESALSTLSSINTDIRTSEEKACSGTAKTSKAWSVGLFATFVQFITLGGEISHSSTSTTEIQYSCDSIETKRFTPSAEYITKAAQDGSVKMHLKAGGLGAKAFIITGVKIARGATITTTQEAEKDTTIQVGVDIPPAQPKIGPKINYKPSTLQSHTRTIEGPIVFAFEVEKIRVSRKGDAISKRFVDGAMLGQKNEAEYAVERAEHVLDGDEMDDFGLEAQAGTDDVTGEACQIIYPSSD